MTEFSRYKDKDVKRVGEFVEHLLSGPAVEAEPVIIAGRLILNFLVKNRARLAGILKNPQFFPGLEWGDVIDLISRDINDRILSSSLPVINKFIENTDLSFFDRYSESGIVADSHRREMLHEFVIMLFRDDDCRFSMNSAVNILKFGVVDRYIGESFKRRDSLYGELARGQKAEPGAEEYMAFIKTMLLVRNAACMKMNVSMDAGEAELSLRDVKGDDESLEFYLAGATRRLSGMLPGIPAGIIRLSLKSNLPAANTGDDEAAARLLYILCARYQHHRQLERIDRGAESQDRSWFAAAVKNSRYLGYDAGMAEALRLIAGENNW